MRRSILINYKKIVKIVSILILIVINFACSNSALKDNGAPKYTVNSYYSQNRLPEVNYRLSRNAEYFKFVNDTNEKFISGNSDKEYLTFFKNKNIRGYGASSSYWRWEIHYTQKQIDNIINNNLYNIGQDNSKNIYKLVNHKWQQVQVQKNPVGTVKELKVMKRGSSGVVMDLYIRGSKGEFLITRENRVRRAFSYSKSSLGGLSAPVMIGKTGKPINTASTLFPSGFFAIEKKSNGFTIYGGGFGHGIGLPQYAARDLANKGVSYDNILKRYYKDIDIKNVRWIKGVNDDIKVGITRNNSIKHQNIILSGDKGLKIKSGRSSYKVAKGKKIEFKRVGSDVVATVDKKVVLRSGGTITISSSGLIRVNSITRALKKVNPEYRGTFAISQNEGSLLLVNTVDLEEYLMQVVGSEMPNSFGLEALKVQSIAARTYAVEGMLSTKYKNFDVVDTISSQVYNNLEESDIVNQAIKQTKGKVMTHNGNIIPAYFYSTSGGYSATPREIW